MARRLEEITEAEVEAAIDTWLNLRHAHPGLPHESWRQMQKDDPIAHEEIGYLFTRVLHAAELAREKV
jgi:hypothetical protein